MKKRVPTKKTILNVLLLVVALAAASAVKTRKSEAAFVPTITVQNSTVGTTPDVLGYNLGHFMVGSNAADWWRYSGVKAVRVFISPSGIEPTDDIAGTGDGVNSSATFFSRRAALRANAANSSQPLDTSYINWPVFYNTYATWVADGSNRFILDPTFTALRAQGIEILANITASPSRFPLAGDTDWANMWELWQHYYAEAFYLSNTYDVRRFGMFNEPNNWTPAITADDWHRRLRVCSDAIQAAVADANTRYGKSLVPQIFAPNTANGSTKYVEWGRPAVTNRHLQLDGTTNTNWLNLHIYNYQKYSMYTNDTGTSSGYIEDIDQLYADTAADMAGETVFPMALTEFNVRTGANYDTMTATQDSPSDYSAFGANVVALTEHLAKQLYLFKFAQTERTGGTYPVAKNGTHYVENATTGVNNYGGATKVAEVWRLFNKAAKGVRPRYALTHTLGSDVWPMATFDAAANMWYVFISNKNTGSVTVDLDISALGVANGNQAVIEEVSANYSGGVAATPTVSGGQLNGYSLPAQSVCLISIPAAAQTITTINATEDTQLGDGTSKNTTGGAVTSMQVRADATANGRRVTLIKVPTSGLVPADLQRVLLSLTAGTISSSATIQSHVYALNNDSWTESGATWAGLTAALKQNVGSGNVIANNIVANQGTTMQMLGQLLVTSSTNSEKLIDVTEYVRAQTDGFASFAIVQEHRWDVAIPALTTGDTQSDGVKIASRETATPPRLRVIANGSGCATAAITTHPANQTVTEGQTATFTVTATGTAPLSYQWRKNGANIGGATGSSYTTPATVLADSGSSFTVVVSNCGGNVTSNAATLTVNAPAQVAAPTFSPAAGTYTSAQSVTISTATAGASIRYTTDGSTPTSTTGTLYSAPVSVAVTTTLKAIAYKAGMADSAVSTAAYTINTGGGGGGPVVAECESLTVAASSGDTYQVSSDANTSGGQFVLYSSNANNDYITFALSVPAGNYAVALSVKKNTDRGQVQMAVAESLGGTYTNIDSSKDHYASSIQYSTFNFTQNVTFNTTGTKYFRFTVTGKTTASSGRVMSFDKLTLTPAPVSAEFESLPQVASSGDSASTKNDTGASGGQWRLLRSNAVNDYVTYSMNIPAGTYAIQILAKRHNDRGIIQFAVADALAGPYTNIDTPKDEYTSAITFGAIPAFTQTVTFATGGTKYLRFTVTGKNAASSDYNISLDKITLTPQ